MSDTARLRGANMRIDRLPWIIAMCVLLVLAGRTFAGEPCAPFAGGRVNAEVLATMRTAGQEGRLYRVVPNNSRVGFCVRYFPLQEFRGEFRQLVGGLALSPTINEPGQALLLIHASSMESSNPALAPLVHSYQFMDTERFPEILFIGHAFQWVNRQHAHLFGDITLHGITRPVVFDIDISVMEQLDGERPGRIHMRGTGQVNRTHFNMRGYRLLVSETVRLCLDMEMLPWGQ